MLPCQNLLLPCPPSFDRFTLHTCDLKLWGVPQWGGRFSIVQSTVSQVYLASTLSYQEHWLIHCEALENSLGNTNIDKRDAMLRLPGWGTIGLNLAFDGKLLQWEGCSQENIYSSEFSDGLVIQIRDKGSRKRISGPWFYHLDGWLTWWRSHRE